MPKQRKEIKELEKLIQGGKKKFVRYAEGAALYSMGLYTFQDLAKEAKAVYHVNGVSNHGKKEENAPVCKCSENL